MKRRHRSSSGIIIGAAALCLAASACGEDANLGGTFTIDYDLSYDRVAVERVDSGGDPASMVIKYVRDLEGGGTEWPVKVTIDFPLTVGVTADLAANGNVEHIAVGGAEFPDLTQGRITFDQLSDVGGDASGEFFATFEGGGTLNGAFSGTVVLVPF